MNYTELAASLTAHLAYDLDGFDGVAPTTPQKVSILNWAIRQVGLSIYLYQDVALTFTTGDRVIALDDTTKFGKAMLTIDNVQINSIMLRDHTRRYGLWTVDQFFKRYPLASAAANSTPVAATIVGNDLTLNCPVSSGWSGFARGRALPKAIADTGYVTPADIPVHLHETIVYLAAIKWSLPNAVVQEQYQRLQTYSGEAMALLVAEFRRGFKQAHGRDPEVAILREACAAYKTVERGTGDRGS
jgi:hypothetical protein